MTAHDLLSNAGLEVPEDELEGIAAWIETVRAMAQTVNAARDLPDPAAAQSLWKVGPDE